MPPWCDATHTTQQSSLIKVIQDSLSGQVCNFHIWVCYVFCCSVETINVVELATNQSTSYIWTVGYVG